MGYTHYWFRERHFPSKKFQVIVEDFRKTLPYLEKIGVSIAGWDGKGHAYISDTAILFNGVENCNHKRGHNFPLPVTESLLKRRYCDGDCSHETFDFPANLPVREYDQIFKVGKVFNFCKTSFKPYDLAVNVCLIIAKHHLGDNGILIYSDGEDDMWEDGRRLCQAVLGYGDDFQLTPYDEE